MLFMFVYSLCKSSVRSQITSVKSVKWLLFSEFMYRFTLFTQSVCLSRISDMYKTIINHLLIDHDQDNYSFKTPHTSSFLHWFEQQQLFCQTNKCKCSNRFLYIFFKVRTKHLWKGRSSAFFFQLMHLKLSNIIQLNTNIQQTIWA